MLAQLGERWLAAAGLLLVSHVGMKREIHRDEERDSSAGGFKASLRLMILCSRSHCSSQEDTYSVLIRFGKSILVAVLLMFG